MSDKKRALWFVLSFHVLAAALLVPAHRADAAELTAPDANGFYAHCTVAWSEPSSSLLHATASETLSAVCNSASGYRVDSLQVRWNADVNPGAAQNTKVTASCLNSHTPLPWSGSRDDGALVDKCQSTADRGGIGGYDYQTDRTPSWSALNTSRSSSAWDTNGGAGDQTSDMDHANNGCVAVLSNGQPGTFPCKIDSVVYDEDGFPAPPGDWYPGGVPNNTSEVPPPPYLCGRTIRDIGGGQFVADLEAFGPTDDVNEWEVEDDPDVTGSEWRIDWGGTLVQANEQNESGSGGLYRFTGTATLPPMSEMPGGGWYAYFVGRRYVGGTALGEAPASEDFDRLAVDVDGDVETPDEYWYVFGPPTAYALQRIEELMDLQSMQENLARLLVQGGFRLQDDEDEDVEALATVITSRCAVLIDPTRPSLGGTGDPGGGGGQIGPPGPPGDDGEDGEDADNDGTDDGCAFKFGWSLLNPLNIARQIGCMLSGLFIPDDLGAIEDFTDTILGVFPFNLGADIANMGDAIADAATAGQASGGECGPSLDLRFAVQKMPGHDQTADDEAWQFNLPSPSTSECAAMVSTLERSDWDDEAGDLWGYREIVRAIGYLALAMLVFRRLINAAKDRDDLDVDL